LFQQAIAADPNYALAWAGLADTYNVAPSYGIGIDSKRALLLSDEASNKAVQLDDSLSETHSARASALAFNWRWNEAEAQFRRAIELNPNNSTAHYFYGFTLLLPQNRIEESLAEIRTALSLDPLSPIINTNYGWARMAAHHYDESLAQFQKTIQRDPNFGPAHFKLSHLLSSMGRYADAVTEAKKSALVKAEFATLDARGYCAVNQAVTGGDRDASSAPACAATDRELAFRSLRLAYENHDLVGEFIRSPEFDPLRSDSRYIEIMRNMGLNP
jgi:Tfp pilus assembly protein PilF